MNEENLKSEIKKKKNLIQNKNKSEEEIAKSVKLNNKLKEFKNRPLFDIESTDEKIKSEAIRDQELAENLFKQYLEAHEIDSFSDLDTLRSLVYNEIFESKIQREISKLQVPNERLTNQLIEIQNQKSELKIKLGIDKEEHEENQLTVLQQLEKRFQRYIEENREEFTLGVPFICNHCKKEDFGMYLLRRRVKDFSVMKHPWYAGRFLFNYPVFKFIKQGILTKEQGWEILCGAALGKNSKDIIFQKEYAIDYIDWVLNSWGEITRDLEN